MNVISNDNIPKELSEAIEWSLESLERVKNKIVDYGLDKNDAMTEICQFLDDKYGTPAKDIEIGSSEIARPLNKKMRWFNDAKGHAFVRVRLGLRRGVIEEQDCIPIAAHFKEEGINKMVIKLRPFPAKFAPLIICEGHERKFRTRVSRNFLLDQFLFNSTFS